MSKSANLHGQVIDYSNIDKIPGLEKFLDRDLTQKVRIDMNRGKPLLFMPNGTWDERPMQEEEYQKSKYKLVVFGILENGERRTIVINDIEPYFEIKIPDKEENRALFAENMFYELHMEGDVHYEKYKRQTQTQKNAPTFGFKVEPTRYEICRGKPLHGFQEHDSHYIKVYFDKLAHREYAIRYVRGLRYETAHDDLNNYYRVVSRDYFIPLASWWTIQNYQLDYDNRYIRDTVIQMSIGDIKPYDGEMHKHLQKDNTLTMAFDIETYNADEDGEIPYPQYPNHCVFMISMTFQFYHAAGQLINVCLVDVPTAPHPDHLTVVCGTERNLLRAFGMVCEKLKPHFIMGFNSDAYDWNWIVRGALRYPGLLGEIVDMMGFQKQENITDKNAEYTYKPNNIKVSADTNCASQNIQLNLYTPFDVMIVFRQIYPTSEKWSLNFFLAMNKLGGKEDMPYQEMFQIYHDTKEYVHRGMAVPQELLDKMALVANYCVVDSIRCHDLTLIRNVIPDKREIANLSYTNIHDAFYRANGMKVRNLIISRATPRNIKISNIPNEEIENGKYPGAWVFPPIKGLITSKLSIRERIEKAKQKYGEYSDWLDVTDEDIESYKEIIDEVGPVVTDAELEGLGKPVAEPLRRMLMEETGRPITGLDYSSLYPSIMMTYNLSPEYMITNIKYAKVVNKMVDEDGKPKHELYKVKFNYNGRDIRGWSVRHDNKLDPTKPDYKFGIFPSILKELFDARAKLKKGEHGLLYWEHIKEKMSLLPKEDFEKPRVKEEWEDACFQYNLINSKQAALKVYMNCFYGESGNKRSPLFMLQVAGGVTTAGRYNIKRAYEYVSEQGCKVYYGDTDSLYLAMPEANFKKLDIDYYTEKISKQTYWEEMIRITFKTIKPLNKDVNDMLQKDNGTNFLKMAYEEALYPCTFFAKKKYLGIPHISEPNFNLNKDGEFNIFLKGLTMKARGVSGLLVDYSKDVIQKSVNPNNIYTIMEIVKKSIEDFYKVDWTAPELYDSFVMSDVFRPKMNNVKMHVFNRRMIEERGTHIVPGDRIKYVIAKKPQKYDYRGRKVALSVGDQMEIAEVAKEEGLSIDVDYYMNKKIAGQLARFITYHEDFQVPVQNYDDSVEVKAAEDKNLKLARKYIDNYSSQYTTSHVDRGPLYKNIFRKSAKIVKSNFIDICGNNAADTAIITLLGYSVDPDKDLETWLLERIRKEVEKKPKNKNYGKSYIDSLLGKSVLEANARTRSQYILDLQNSYYVNKNNNKNNNILYFSEEQYKERQQILERRFGISINKVKSLYHTNNDIIASVADHIKSRLKIEEINDDTKDIDVYLQNTGMDMADFDKSLAYIAKDKLDKSMETIMDSIAELKFIYYNLISNYEFIYQIRSIVDYLKILRNKSIGVIKAPSKKEISNMIDKFAKDISLG
jgi:DNA polymerase elongation subunit (family B)/DNA-binding transcriptional MerR regulator